MLKLKRPLCVIDCETTGTDIAMDAIFSLAIIRITPGSPVDALSSYLIKPWKPIPPEVEELTGVTNAMVSTSAPFSKVAGVIAENLAGADLCGFNCRNFDIPIIYEEMARCGITLPLEGVNIIDAGNIFKLKEKRSLEAAVQFYCGREMEGAHDAMVDTRETLNVLLGQLKRYPDLAEMDTVALAEFSKMDKRVDLAGKIVLNDAGVPVYNFGKSKGIPVVDDPGFARWIISKDFTAQTKKVLMDILDEEERRYQAESAKKEGDLF